MALQFRRYPNSQIFAFDFGGSIRAAALAMGGDWHDLGGALSDDATEPVALAAAGADRRCRRARLGGGMDRRDPRRARRSSVTPEAKDHLWSALTSLASAPIAERTLTGLSVLLQSQTPEARAAALLPRRPLWPAARCRSRASRRSRRPGLRDRGADRHRRRAGRAGLSVPPHRRPARRPADAADHR